MRAVHDFDLIFVREVSPFDESHGGSAFSLSLLERSREREEQREEQREGQREEKLEVDTFRRFVSKKGT